MADLSSLVSELFPYLREKIKVQGNKIVVQMIFLDYDNAMKVSNLIKSMVCRHIKVNHYVWTKHLDEKGQEIEERICIFPPHRAPELLINAVGR